MPKLKEVYMYYIIFEIINKMALATVQCLRFERHYFLFNGDFQALYIIAFVCMKAFAVIVATFVWIFIHVRNICGFLSEFIT